MINNGYVENSLRKTIFPLIFLLLSVIWWKFCLRKHSGLLLNQLFFKSLHSKANEMSVNSTWFLFFQHLRRSKSNHLICDIMPPHNAQLHYQQIYDTNPHICHPWLNRVGAYISPIPIHNSINTCRRVSFGVILLSISIILLSFFLLLLFKWMITRTKMGTALICYNLKWCYIMYLIKSQFNALF